MLRISRVAVGAFSAVVLALTMVSCGNGTSGDGIPTPTGSVDEALSAKVPADIKAAGKLVIGVDPFYPPNEYLDLDGETVIGWDVELFDAVAAKLGLQTEWEPAASFDSIIPGIMSGKYDVGVSSFTINPDRLEQVNLVSYFNAGTGWAAKPGSGITPDNACGKKVAVQTGTVQVDDIQAKSKACTDAGKPAIIIDQYQAQTDATTAVITGKDDAVLADSPIIAYAVKQTNGQLENIGEIYDAAPYGIAVPKDQTEFAEAIAEAFQAVIADGTYGQILDKWGVANGGIDNPTANPAV